MSGGEFTPFQCLLILDMGYALPASDHVLNLDDTKKRDSNLV